MPQRYIYVFQSMVPSNRVEVQVSVDFGFRLKKYKKKGYRFQNT